MKPKTLQAVLDPSVEGGGGGGVNATVAMSSSLCVPQQELGNGADTIGSFPTSIDSFTDSVDNAFESFLTETVETSQTITIKRFPIGCECNSDSITMDAWVSTARVYPGQFRSVFLSWTFVLYGLYDHRM
ncbi:hypothetical protein TMatcc_004479 [Talaromyces marneffei ATCC 18224]